MYYRLCIIFFSFIEIELKMNNDLKSSIQLFANYLVKFIPREYLDGNFNRN